MKKSPVLPIEIPTKAKDWLSRFPLGKDKSNLNPHDRSFFVYKMILSSDESPLCWLL